MIRPVDVPPRAYRTIGSALRRSRTKQANALLEATRSVLRPTILLGDLNEWRVHSRSSLLALLPHFGPIHTVLSSFPSRFPLLALDRILANHQV